MIMGVISPAGQETLPNNCCVLVVFPCLANNLTVEVSPLFFRSTVNV